MPISKRRENRRVMNAKLACTKPALIAAAAARKATVSAPTPNSSMIFRKMSGSVQGTPAENSGAKWRPEERSVTPALGGPTMSCPAIRRVSGDPSPDISPMIN